MNLKTFSVRDGCFAVSLKTRRQRSQDTKKDGKIRMSAAIMDGKPRE
jgi:hypothetical protein